MHGKKQACNAGTSRNAFRLAETLLVMHGQMHRTINFLQILHFLPSMAAKILHDQVLYGW